MSPHCLKDKKELLAKKEPSKERTEQRQTATKLLSRKDLAKVRRQGVGIFGPDFAGLGGYLTTGFYMPIAPVRKEVY